MNILYITRSSLSFSRAHTRNIVKTVEFLNQEDDMHVVLFSSAKESKTREQIFNEKEVHYPYTLDVSHKKRSLIKAIFRRRNTFDVLYFRDPSLWRIAWFVKKWWRKRILFEVHGSEEWGTKAPWKKSVAVADGLVFITQKLKDYYNPVTISVVTHTNGNNEEQKKAENIDMNAMRDIFGLPKERTLIGIMGSFQWDSRELLLTMLALLPVEVELVFVGIKEDDVQLLQEQARMLGIMQRVHIVSRVPPKDVFFYICTVDILVNPLIISYPGSISSKLYEYLVAGKPIVTSLGGANDEVIKNGKNGIIVDPPTPEGFAETIKEILKNKPRSEALSLYAKESAKQYTWEARVKSIASIIKRI